MSDYIKLIGTPFVDGGRDPKIGLDCYGLLMEVFSGFGISIPEYFASALNDQAVSEQVEKVRTVEWKSVDRKNLPVPCVVLLRFNSSLCNHVGAYIGNGRFIHCRNPIGVNIDRIDSPAWRHRIEGFYILDEGE